MSTEWRPQVKPESKQCQSFTNDVNEFLDDPHAVCILFDGVRSA